MPFISSLGRYRRVPPPPRPESPDPAGDPSPPSDFKRLWSIAYNQYQVSLPEDLRFQSKCFLDDMEDCETPDGILGVLRAKATLLSDKRQGGGKSQALREAIKPMVRGLSVVLNTAAETASGLQVPGGKGIFVAIAVLLKAAENMSVTSDNLEKLFERLRACVQRLEVHLKSEMSHMAKEIAVRALVQVLKTMELATKAMQKGRAGRFIDELLAKPSDVRSALEKLEEITIEEQALTVVEISVGIRELRSEVHAVHVNAPLSRIVEACDDVRPLIGHMDATTHAIYSQNVEMLALLRGMRELIPASDGHAMMVEAQRENTSVLPEASPVAPRLTRLPSRFRLARLGGQLISQVVSGFSTGNQTIILRGLSTLLIITHAGSASLVRTTTPVLPFIDLVTMPVAAFLDFLQMALMFLFLFITWQQNFAWRPLAQPGGSVIIIDILGKHLTLDANTFSTWENTHAFLLQAFQGRLGATFVQNEKYGLGDSEHLLIESGQWTEVVRPGAVLDMSIIVSGERAPRCPYCQQLTSDRDARDGDSRIICSNKECARPYNTHRRDIVPDQPPKARHQDERVVSPNEISPTEELVPQGPEGQPHRASKPAFSPEIPPLHPKTEHSDKVRESLHSFHRVIVEFSLETTSVPGSFHSLWNDALQLYQEETGNELLKFPFATELLSHSRTTDEILQYIEEQNGSFTAFRASGRKILDAVKSIVHTVHRLIDATAEGASNVTAGGKAIFVAIGALLRAAKGVSGVYDAIEYLLWKISARLARIEVYLEPSSLQNTALMDILRMILVQVFIVIGIATKYCEKASDIWDSKSKGKITVRAMMQRAKDYSRMLLDETEVEDALKELEELTEEEGLMAAADTNAVVRKVKPTVDYLYHKAVIDDLRLWLDPPHPRPINYDAKRRAGSCEWFFDDQFEDWKTRKNGIYAVYGNAGAGKSVLSLSIVDKLNADATLPIVYFHFDFRDTKKQNCRALVSSLVFQLGTQLEECLAYVKGEGSLNPPTYEKLLTVLSHLLSQSGPAFIIIDALDECPETARDRDLVELLDTLRGRENDNIRLLITSRPEPDIQAHLSRVATHTLNFDEALLHTVELPHTGIYDGINDIESALAELPSDLDETYKRILERFPPAPKRTSSLSPRPPPLRLPVE